MNTSQIEFSEQGYRQLVMAVREAHPVSEPAPELQQLVSDGEAGYIDSQGLIRWVKTDRVGDVPDTWRPLLIGPSRREAAGA